MREVARTSMVHMSPSVAATSSPTIASPSSWVPLLGLLSPPALPAAPFSPFSPSPLSPPSPSSLSPHSGPMKVNSTFSSFKREVIPFRALILAVLQNA